MVQKINIQTSIYLHQKNSQKKCKIKKKIERRGQVKRFLLGSLEKFNYITMIKEGCDGQLPPLALHNLGLTESNEGITFSLHPIVSSHAYVNIDFQ